MPISLASPLLEGRALAGPLRRLVRSTLAREGLRAGDIGLLLAGDRELRDLNRRYRGLDRATDVLSFGYGESSPHRRPAGLGLPERPSGGARPDAAVPNGRPEVRGALDERSAPRIERVPRRMRGRACRRDSRAGRNAGARRDPPAVSGDIAVSLDRMAEQARRYGCARGEELARLVVHGALHLAGHDHGSAAERRRMRAREDAALRRASAEVRMLSRALGRPRRPTRRRRRP